MITQISCKLTNSLLIHAERQGVSLNALFELFDGPEEFLRDPHFWMDLELCERFFVRAARIIGDPYLGTTVGNHIYELHALGALDHVFKMMPSQKDYYNNLPRFFSYFLAPLGDFKELEHGDTFVRFSLPFSAVDYRHIFGYLRGVLESLPRFTGHLSSHTEWDQTANSLYLTWESAQPSLFDIEPGQVLNPFLIQTLSAQLEATERALETKNRQVLAQKAELDQMKLELQTQVREKIYAEKMTGLAQLAAGVAHEINNPLSYVMSNLGRFEEYFRRLQSYIDLLERGQTPTVELKKQLDIEFIFAETPAMMREAGEGLKRVKEIVKDLSSLAHPQNGRAENKILMDLNGVLDSTLKVFQDELSTGKITLNRNFKLQSSVRVFPVRMSQVFMNLLSNSIQAISEKGTIDIHTTERDGAAVIEIADTGSGMDESVMARIFTPFFTTKEVGKGTGLGLSIAQSIVEMHKGRIDVKSERGKGSRFTVTLPLQGH